MRFIFASWSVPGHLAGLVFFDILGVAIIEVHRRGGNFAYSSPRDLSRRRGGGGAIIWEWRCVFLFFFFFSPSEKTHESTGSRGIKAVSGTMLLIKHHGVIFLALTKCGKVFFPLQPSVYLFFLARCFSISLLVYFIRRLQHPFPGGIWRGECVRVSKRGIHSLRSAVDVSGVPNPLTTALFSPKGQPLVGRRSLTCLRTSGRFGLVLHWSFLRDCRSSGKGPLGRRGEAKIRGC